MLLPLRKLRKYKGITQAELSKALKISPSTVGMWEQGRREPDYEMLKKIADYFNVTTDYLLGHDSKNCSLSKSQAELLSAFEELNDDGQNLLEGMIGSLKLSHSKQKANNANVVQKNLGGINNLAVNGNIYSK